MVNQIAAPNERENRLDRFTEEGAPTCAVLVRGMYDEAPFLNEFLHHYLALGFNRIYYVNTSSHEGYLRRTLPSRLLRRVSIINISRDVLNWQLIAVNQARTAITEEWFINLDMDEFLFLNGRTIQQFIADIPPQVAVIRIPWHIVLSANYFEPSVTRTGSTHQSRSLQFKSMGRTVAIDNCGLHDMAITDGTVAYHVTPAEDRAIIAHFASRGFYDLIGRIVDRNYENSKSSHGQAMKLSNWLKNRDAALSEYPFRLHLYRVMMSFPWSKAPFPLTNSSPEFSTDVDLLRAIFAEKLSQIDVDIPKGLSGEDFDAYVDHKFDVRNRLLRELPPDRFSRLHFSERLSYQNVTHAYINSLSCEEMP